MNRSITINKYKEQMMRMCKLLYPQMGYNEISKAIDYSINKRLNNRSIGIRNSYTNKEYHDINMLMMADNLQTKKPIMSSYGVLFKRHDEDPSVNSPIYDLLEVFISNRDKNKEAMFKFPKGSEQFAHYDNRQKLDKLDCNALYGCIGQRASMIYNINLAQSVTFQGRACISAAILFFESFLADNFKWMNLNEIITFIDEVLYQDQWKFSDEMFNLKNHDISEVFFKIMKNCGFNGYIPSNRDMQIVWNILEHCTQAQLNRLYYRNNLYEFCDNESITKAIIALLQMLKEPFENPNKPNPEIQEEIQCLREILQDYVYHPHLNMNRIDRVLLMDKCVSIITDTDSSIISFDRWYHYVLSKIGNIPLRINMPLEKKYRKVGEPLFSKPIKMYDIIKYKEDIDFYTGEIVYVPELRKMYYKDPRDNLRHSIINIMAYIISQLIGDYMQILAEHYNTYERDGKRKCLIIMKNEFLFKRALVTNAKKNYASIQELQEGNKIPPDKALDIKGMQIDKSTLPNETKVRLKHILDKYVLRADKIDQVAIIKQLAIFEKYIYQSLANGEKKFYKPMDIKSIGSYENPMGQQGIRAAVIYNTLKDPKITPINLNARTSIDVVKLDMNMNNIEKIKDEYPEVYDKAVELMKLDEFKDGINYIAIPLDEQVPKWVIPFIDYTTIIHNNISPSTFPIKQLGLTDFNKKTLNYTNILKF